MEKDDLKTGMVIELKDGRVGILINDVIRFRSSYLYTQYLKYDLTCPDNHEFDVITIYKPNSEYDLLNYGNNLTQIIWSRELPILSLTIADIAKKFKVKSKQIVIVQ